MPAGAKSRAWTPSATPPPCAALLAGLLGLASACLYAMIYIFFIFGVVGKHGAINHLLAGIPA